MASVVDRVAPFLLCALLSGCNVGPNHVVPEPQLAGEFIATDGVNYSAEPLATRLWQSFNEPELDALIARALTHNKSIAQALATLNETRALSGLTIYSYFPTVTAATDFERNSASSADPQDFPGRGISERYRLGFDSTWEIDLFGNLRRQREAIFARTDGNEAALAAVQLSIVAEVAQSYFALRGAQERLRIQQRNLAAQADSVSILAAALDAGRGTALDVSRAKALERSLAAQLPQVELAVTRAEQRLAVLTAQAVAELRSELAERRALPAMPQLVAIGTPQEWLRRRPDVHAAERRLAAATADIGVEVAQFYPILNLVGGFGWTASSSRDVGSSRAERWQLGPELSWRFLDFGRVKQFVRASEARAAGALAEFEGTLLAALEETENALAGFRATATSAAALNEAVAESRNASALAQLRYDNGAGDYLEVLDARRTQLDLEDQHAAAVTDRATSLAALYKALGGDFAGSE